jgi:hypothetical protein
MNGRDETTRKAAEDRVLARLAVALDETDPVPPRLIDAAIDLYTWRAVDAELLELLVDSAAADVGAVRDGDTSRVIAFGMGDQGVHFECRSTGVGVSLDGAVQPPGVFEVVVERPGESIVTLSDASGVFHVGPVAPGTVRLLVRSRKGSTIMVTPWFVLES